MGEVSRRDVSACTQVVHHRDNMKLAMVVIALATLAVANAGSVDVDQDNKITIRQQLVAGLEDMWQQLVAPLSDGPPPAFCKIAVNGPGSATECAYGPGPDPRPECMMDPRCVGSSINGLKVCDTQCCMKEEDVRGNPSGISCGEWDVLGVPFCLGVVCGNYDGTSLQGDAYGTYGKYKTSYCLARVALNGPSSTTGAYGWKRCSSDAGCDNASDCPMQL